MTRISVIVAAYQAAETLPALLDSLAGQSLPADEFEAIVVDDGSTDGSRDIIARYPGVRLLTQTNRGPGAARNLATQAATGDIIAYTDADVVLPPHWLATHLRLHEEHPKIDAMLGSVRPGTRVPFGSSVLADHLCSWFNAHPGLPERVPDYLPSVNISVKRRVIDAGVAWSEKRITGEDVDFSRQMTSRGMKLHFFPENWLCHTDRQTLPGFLRHQYNWGFHAPFIRGRNKGAKYGFLFPPSTAGVLLRGPLIVGGYTLLTLLAWWRSRPIGLLSAIPLILMGKVWYFRGVLAGTRALLGATEPRVADRRVCEPPVRGVSSLPAHMVGTASTEDVVA